MRMNDEYCTKEQAFEMKERKLQELKCKMQEKLLYKMDYIIDKIGYSSSYQTHELRFKDYAANKELSETLLNVIEAYKEIKAVTEEGNSNA